MKIVNILMTAAQISRFIDPSVPSGRLTPTMVAVVRDVVRAGRSLSACLARRLVLP